MSNTVQAKVVTVGVRMDLDLLAAIMRAVEVAGPESDRSGWIRDAVREKLEREAGAKK